MFGNSQHHLLRYVGEPLNKRLRQTHYWDRHFQQRGHKVLLVPEHIAAKYRMGNKNDANDALAIYESINRPKTYFVQVKNLEQQDLACLLKLRQGYVKQRTQTANRIRGLVSVRQTAHSPH